jgi:hypothetical protein
MKISLIGPGDIDKIIKFAKISKRELDELILNLGKYLAEINAEIVLLPSKGITYEIAEAYKKNNGKKVIGLVPESDKKYGIKHIKDYFSIADELVNIGNWYDLNGEIAGYSDYAIVIGYSCGVATEIGMLKYHFKYLNSDTKLIIFENTISQKLHKEMEADLKNLYYVKSIKELKEIIKK